MTGPIWGVILCAGRYQCATVPVFRLRTGQLRFVRYIKPDRQLLCISSTVCMQCSMLKLLGRYFGTMPSCCWNMLTSILAQPSNRFVGHSDSTPTTGNLQLDEMLLPHNL